MKIAESDIMVAHCCDPFSYFTTPITVQSSVTQPIQKWETEQSYCMYVAVFSLSATISMQIFQFHKILNQPHK